MSRRRWPRCVGMVPSAESRCPLIPAVESVDGASLASCCARPGFLGRTVVQRTRSMRVARADRIRSARHVYRGGEMVARDGAPEPCSNDMFLCDFDIGVAEYCSAGSARNERTLRRKALALGRCSSIESSHEIGNANRRDCCAPPCLPGIPSGRSSWQYLRCVNLFCR